MGSFWMECAPEFFSGFLENNDCEDAQGSTFEMSSPTWLLRENEAILRLGLSLSSEISDGEAAIGLRGLIA